MQAIKSFVTSIKSRGSSRFQNKYARWGTLKKDRL